MDRLNQNGGPGKPVDAEQRERARLIEECNLDLRKIEDVEFLEHVMMGFRMSLPVNLAQSEKAKNEPIPMADKTIYPQKR